MALILASKSPRRKQLLEQMGLSFSVRAADVDETMDPTLTPAQAVAELSRRKAAATECAPEDVVIAADTVVVLGETILGKPRTEEEAVQMLRNLSGRKHQVMTGVTVQKGEETLTFTEITDVFFRNLSETEISAYVATGDPMDKAGSYGIQGLAALFAEKLCGDYFNVMGLPVCALGKALRHFGVEVLGEKG